jgi:hypothetical protein
MAELVLRSHLGIYFVLEFQLLFAAATTTIFLQLIAFLFPIFPSADELLPRVVMLLIFFVTPFAGS